MPKTALAIAYAGKKIPFQVDYSARKSLQISVHPDGAVLVKAPRGADERVVVERVRRRAQWISRQIRYFEQFDPRTPPRRFVGGESHLYLGRNYRLKIHRDAPDRVSLTRGFFHIHAADPAPPRIEALLQRWYRQRAEVVFAQALEECWRSFPHAGARQPTIRIRNMKTRWGSLSAAGRMTLNLQLIKAPPECIRYVVMHELCHLIHRGHGREFHRLLESLIPDWQRVKDRLEKALS